MLWLAPIGVDPKWDCFYFDCPFGLRLISALIEFWVFHVHFYAAGGFWVWLSLVPFPTARIVQLTIEVGRLTQPTRLLGLGGGAIKLWFEVHLLTLSSAPTLGAPFVLSCYPCSSPTVL